MRIENIDTGIIHKWTDWTGPWGLVRNLDFRLQLGELEVFDQWSGMVGLEFNRFVMAVLLMALKSIP